MRIAALPSALLAASFLLPAVPAGSSTLAPAKVIARLDLTRPFRTRSPWWFVARQQPDIMINEYPYPGELRYCLTDGANRPCRAALPSVPHPPAPMTDEDWAPHTIDTARLVYPHGRDAPPLLLLQMQGEPSAGDGERTRFTLLVSYDRAAGRFVPVFQQMTFHNNNQVTRYIESGPLAGAMLVAEPTGHAPFGFWVTVSRPNRAYHYRQVLRYRSATHYGDGNLLSVADSEMPNILHRLGQWRSGAPLPVPARGCPKPRLLRMELWCR
jgi:hypothetical protein